MLWRWPSAALNLLLGGAWSSHAATTAARAAVAAEDGEGCCEAWPWDEASSAMREDSEDRSFERSKSSPDGMRSVTMAG